MSEPSERVPAEPAEQPITGNDPRIVQMLSTEHWSVLSSRSLAYNETFTRAGMFLSFLSMSMVALGLLVQGTGFNRDFTVIAAFVLGFDLLIGLSTYLRIGAANVDDLVALHGMSRIRHAYTEISPALKRYFTAPVNDDVPSLLLQYNDPWNLGDVVYALSTTLGMIGLIVSAIGGVFAGLIASLFSTSGLAAILVGVGVGVAMFVALAVTTFKMASASQQRLDALFPAEHEA